jgi:arylsulfatase A-like enzyme
VSLVSLAATFLEVAGQPAPVWVEGASLPLSDDDARARSFDSTVTEWDSALFGVDVHVRSVVTASHLYSEYQPGTLHDGSEGELYDLADDPLQRVNRFSDPAFLDTRATLHERLLAHEERPGERAEPGVVMAPV